MCDRDISKAGRCSVNAVWIASAELYMLRCRVQTELCTLQ